MEAAQVPYSGQVAVDDRQARAGRGCPYPLVAADVLCLTLTGGPFDSAGLRSGQAVGRLPRRSLAKAGSTLDVCRGDRVFHASGDRVHAAALGPAHLHTARSSPAREIP